MLFFVSFLLCSMTVRSQTFTEGRITPYMTWDDFAAEYAEMSNNEEEDDNGSLTHSLDILEQLHTAPLNLNIASRDDLLALPILTEEQADSILLYRKQRRLFLSLGELQFVSGLDYNDRCRLSLFVYAGDTIRIPPTWKQQLLKGHHEVSFRLDQPLYRRAALKEHTAEELKKNPNAVYLGYNIAHALRYRHTYGRSTAYGLTFQNDVGEPFGERGNYPCDYASAYFYHRTNNERLSYWLGDYEVNAAQGLLIGNSFMSNRLGLVSTLPIHRTVVRPHTSNDETDYLRGGAVQLKFGDWAFTAFASWRKLDGRLENDTLRSFLTTGYHRTEAELSRRRVVGQLTGGLHADYQKANYSLGFTLLYDHYDKPIFPALRAYNRYYLRSQTAAGTSVDYSLHSRHWNLQGEVATDRNLHLATCHSLRYKATLATAFTLQLRHFSPRYVAPHAETLAQSSYVQNETGMLFGVSSFLTPRLETVAYGDFFVHHRPTYRASRGASKGMEAVLKVRYAFSDPFSFTLKYKFKTRQQDVTSGTGALQYIGFHRLNLTATYMPSSQISANVGLAGSLYATQTSRTDAGWMFSTRTTYSPSDVWTFSLFTAVFFTDNYTTRLYAYEPQLRYGSAFPNFAYHGLRTVVLSTYKPFSGRLQLSLRYSLLHYFNRATISSGTQLIDASSQNDLSLLAILKF